MVSAISVAGGVIGFVFAAFVVFKYVKNGRVNNLCWAVGLVLWGVVSLLEATADPATGGWDPNAYRIYYVHSASLVALLGAGTLYLLKEQRYGEVFLIFTIVVAVLFSVIAGLSPTDPAALARGGSIGGEGWAADPGRTAAPRYVTFLLTIPGSIVLIGGAFLSWWRTRTVYNLLIGIGAMVIAAAGVLARVGLEEFIPLGNILSISLMFVGFVYAAEEVKLNAAAPAVEKKTAG
jgi:hypothetical protein